MKSPIIVGFTGPAGSGKDAAAAVLVRELGYKRYAFADPLKADLVRLDPIVDPYHGLKVSEALKLLDGDMESLKKYYPEWRRLCQRYGTEVWRQNDPDIWVERLEAAMHLDWMDNATPGYVVPDIRFLNEARGIKFDMIFRIYRPDHKVDVGHASEQNFAAIPITGVIKNDGTIEDLEQKTLHETYKQINRIATSVGTIHGNGNPNAEHYYGSMP